MKKEKIRLFEVGPRDGLQNESSRVSLEDKLFWIRALRDAGLHTQEVGAFVRPDRVPQMSDSAEVLDELSKEKKLDLWVLIPNQRGLENALTHSFSGGAVFTGASEEFVQRNIGMKISDSLKIFKPIVGELKKKKKKTRAYLSTAFYCPFKGKVSLRKSLSVFEKLLDLGVDEVSVGDTIGMATPNEVKEMLKEIKKITKLQKVYMHFHDTRGTALSNTYASLEMGVRGFDSSAGGLGGCPFAPGAAGNLATEDLVFLLHRMGFQTGVNLEKLCEVSDQFLSKINKVPGSKYLLAEKAKKQRKENAGQNYG